MITAALILASSLTTYDCEMDSLSHYYQLTQQTQTNCKESSTRRECDVTYYLSEINGPGGWSLKGKEITTLNFDFGYLKDITLSDQNNSVELKSGGINMYDHILKGKFTQPHWPQGMKCKPRDNIGAYPGNC